MTDQKPDKPSERAPGPVAAKRIDRVNGWLHVGGALPPDEYERLREAGITCVVDLREEDAADVGRLRELGVEHRHVPVPDQSSPAIEQLVAVTRWFAEREPGAEMYVHCKGGFGRAATMAVGLLVAQGTPLNDAIRQVREARPEMRLNDEQLAWLRMVEEQRDKDTSENQSE